MADLQIVDINQLFLRKNTTAATFLSLIQENLRFLIFLTWYEAQDHS